jgi:HEAT repeat protein
VVFVADDLGAWIVGLLADAGRRRLTMVVLGTDQERALRQAATAAVQLTANELRPGDDGQAQYLAMVVSQVFCEPAPGPPLTGNGTLLEALQAGVAGQLAVLGDPSLTGTGESSADVFGVPVTVLADRLISYLVREIVVRGSRGGPLTPLANQLNHDVTYLQGQRVEGTLAQLAVTIQDSLTRLERGLSEVVPPDLALAPERERYLARLLERYRRVDLEVLTPLTEQGEHPHMLLRTVFVPQHVRANPPPLELPREFWLRIAETGEVRASDLPDNLDRETIERTRKVYQERPAQPVLEVIARPAGRRIVLLGDPGAGKSTIAQYLMIALAGQLESADGALPGEDAVAGALAGFLPLLVELRTFASPQWHDRTFLDFIDHLHATENLGLPRSVLEPFLQQGGRALVVFDGLDEIFDPGLREQITRQIEAFAAIYPQTRVIVTSRVFGYRRAILDTAGFTHWMLQDLDSSQIEAFTATWYESSCPDNLVEAAKLRDRLLRAVQDSAAVAELAGNPMLLTILAIIGRRRELPRERRAVYDHAVSVLIEHWDATGKHLHDARVDGGMEYLSREDKLELLRLVARRMQDGPASLAGNHLPGPDLCSEFESFLHRRFQLPASRAAPAARGMLDQLRERNFILARFGAGVYGFVHRAFLEYLAADDISARFAAHEISAEEVTQVFADRWNDPAWHEVLVLISGMIPTPFAGAAISRLLSADPASHIQPANIPTHLHLAIRCFGEVRKPGDIAAQGQAISRELISLLETYDANKRSYSLQSLTSSLVSAAVPILTKLGPNWAGRPIYEDWYLARGQYLLPGNYDPELAYASARMYFALLGHGQEAGDALGASATKGSVPDVRRAAVEALAAGWHDDPDIARLLRDRATSDWHEDVRRAAIEALATGWHDDPSTAPLLRDRATTDWNEDVRQAAIEALATGWHDDPSTAPLLRDRATTDWHEGVRQAAIEALATGWHDDPSTVGLLRDRATTDQDEFVRQAAVEALATGWYDDPSTAALLRDRATTDQDEFVRQAAVEALATGWHDDPSTAALLRDRATTDWHEDVREAAVDALATGWRDDPGTAPLLRDRATADHHWDVRWASVDALAAGWHDDPGTAAWLRDRATADWHEDVRRAAVEALATGWDDDPSTAAWLRDRATADHHWDVRRASVEALAAGWHDDPSTAPLLRDRATTDWHESVRQAAVEALATGWHDDPGTAPLLRDRVTADDNWEVRQTAMTALAGGWHDDPSIVPLLHDRATGDQEEWVRRGALEILAARWHDDPGTALLLRSRAKTDRHEDVRQAAVEALASGWHDDPSTASLLQNRIASDLHESVRRTAMEALAIFWHDDPVIAQLLRSCATTDHHWEVRQNAMLAVAALWHGDPDTTSWLCERATSDWHESVRESAIEALATGWHDDPGTAPLLRDRATTDWHESVRQAAIEALATGWHDDPGTAPLLRDRATTDWDWDVRQTAMKALATWPDDGSAAEL